MPTLLRKPGPGYKVSIDDVRTLLRSEPTRSTKLDLVIISSTSGLPASSIITDGEGKQTGKKTYGRRRTDNDAESL